MDSTGYNFVSSLIKLIKLKAQRGERDGQQQVHSGVTSVCVCVKSRWKCSRLANGGELWGGRGGATLRESKVDSKTNAMTSKVLVAYFNLV